LEKISLEIAYNLLTTTQLSMSQIAEQSGYQNGASFAKFFKNSLIKDLARCAA